jgi:F-type H+-transporting ATPase subunit c
MNKTEFLSRAAIIAVLIFAISSVFSGTVYAQDAAAAQEAALAQARGSWHYLGAAIGLGMIVMGAAFGIGKFTAAAAEGIARQPAAAAQISGAVNLPLFLLEGVAILGEVFVLLIVLLR